MIFTVDFKQKVYNALQYNPYLLQCMEALESNNVLGFRIALDMAMDEVKEAAKPRILMDEGERQLWNGIVTQYKAIDNIHTEFMEMFLSNLDSVKMKSHE